MHVHRVYGVCKKLLTTTHDAEDACQEAFIKAWKKLGSFDGAARFGTWLYRVASNECIDRLRKRAHWSNDESGNVVAVDSAPVCEETFDSELATQHALKHLSEKNRAVFILHEFLGYSHEEIAAQASISASTSRAHLHSARKKLRSIL